MQPRHQFLSEASVFSKGPAPFVFKGAVACRDIPRFFRPTRVVTSAKGMLVYLLLPKPSRGKIARNAIIMVNRLAGRRRRITLLSLLAIIAFTAQLARAQSPQPTESAQTPAPSPGMAQLEANQQRKVGQIYYADGDVDIRYRGTRLQADHAEYNAATDDVVLTGHIQFDYLTEHLKADR